MQQNKSTHTHTHTHTHANTHTHTHSLSLSLTHTLLRGCCTLQRNKSRKASPLIAPFASSARKIAQKSGYQMARIAQKPVIIALPHFIWALHFDRLYAECRRVCTGSSAREMAKKAGHQNVGMAQTPKPDRESCMGACRVDCMGACRAKGS